MMKNTNSNIALFDFDGTLTTKDSLVQFIQYAIGKPSYYFGLLMMSPVLVRYKLNLVSNHISKEKLIGYFFKSWESLFFKHVADQYAIEQIDKIIRLPAMKRIRWHQKKGDKVVVVSASIECWIKRWCEKNNIELIATRLEIREGKITGKFSTRNCYGIEKVNRIKDRYNLSEYSVIYAYGDSLGDKEMLGIANKKYYRCFE